MQEKIDIYDTKRLSGKLMSELEMDSEEAEHIEEIALQLGYHCHPELTYEQAGYHKVDQTDLLIVKGTEHQEERIPLYHPDQTNREAVDNILCVPFDGQITYVNGETRFRLSFKERVKLADQLISIFAPELKVKEELEDKLRSWLISDISDEELAKAFGINTSDWKQLFNEKRATFNSYCGSLIDECEYPLCRAKQLL